MKKLLNVLLILAVLFTNLVPTSVLAAKGTNTGSNGSITIKKAVKGEEYSIYRLFLVNSYDTDKNIASYAVESEWANFIENSKFFTLTDSVINGTTQSVITATTLTDSDVADFAKAALAYAEEKGINPVQSKTANSETVEFTDLALGYYLVDSSVGTLCHIDTTTPNAEINEKNTSTPHDTKSIVENGNKVSSNNVKIGDRVDYELLVSGVANLSNVVAKDTMEESLDLDATSISIKVDGTEVNASNYDMTTSTHGFEIKFHDEYLVGMSKEIVITYSAVLNEKAEIAGNGNVNEFLVTYGNKQTVDSTRSVTTYTYEMTLEKVNENGEDLTGAIFQLSQVTSEGLKLLNVVPTDDGYRLANGNEEGMTTSIVAGTVRIYGLENGTYSLEETDAPEGYNKLAKPVEFTIKDANYNGSFKVVNTTGMILPSTGGMGTVLFMTVGSVMALGFGVNLVTKARMRKIED